MADHFAEARRRRWADIVVLVAGLYALIFAIWNPPVDVAIRAGEGVRSAGGWWWVHAFAGTLAVASLFVAMKSAVVARLMVFAAAIVLLLAVLLFREPGFVSLLTLGLPGLLLLIAAPFVGPMPTPEDEAKPRRSLGE